MTQRPTPKESIKTDTITSIVGLVFLVGIVGAYWAACSYAGISPFNRPTNAVNTQLQACLDAIPADTPPGSSKAYRSNCHSKYGK